MEVEPDHAMNYVVTAHRPTAVLRAQVGSFTGPNDLNLVVAKSTRIEVHTSTPQGLEPTLDFPIYGRISSIELFRPKDAKMDLLFVLVEKYKFCVLEYNAQTRAIDTRSYGDVKDQVGRPCDNGQLLAMDPNFRVVGMQLYDGMFKVLPLDSQGRVQEVFNTRLDELDVIDVAFLYGCDKPTVAVLFRDTKQQRHVKAYQINLKDKDLVDLSGTWLHTDMDPGASMLVPTPSGGVLVLGEQSITHLGPRGAPTPSCALRPCVLRAWGRIDADGSRVLLSDNEGLLYILVVASTGGKGTVLKLETVGRTSCASSLCYLDDGVVFVGSRQGDSQLIRLHSTPPDPTAPNSYVQVLETWPSLAPIVDFAVMDLDRQGQGQLVCCSGTLSDGSLRVVRNGVGINEQASIELPGIRGVWSLRGSYMSEHHKYLVLTFARETRVLALNMEEELDEVELPGFDAGAQTLWCGNSASDHLVQVTPSAVRVATSTSGQLLSEWRLPQEEGVQLMSVAAGNATQVVVASSGGWVRLLDLAPQGVMELAAVAVGSEVACVDVTPVGSAGARSHLLAVGSWDMTVRLYTVRQPQAGGPSQLELMATQQLGGDVIPRSVLMWCFEDVPHLLVGLGDGQLLYWTLDAISGALTDRKKLVLGTKPVLLRPFRGLAHGGGGGGNGAAGASSGSGGGAAAGGVFAASDRPAVLYSSNKKILFANLNKNELTYMAPFNCPSFPDSLALAKEDVLTIGTVDQIQKLHIQAAPLHEQPRRIAFQEETHTLGVLTINNLGMEDEENVVRVYDAGAGLELRGSYALAANEMGSAIVSCKLGDGDATPYFVVGTGIAKPDETEPKEGRLLVLQYMQGRITLVAEKPIKGCAYETLPFQAGKLINSCNSKLQVHRWVQKDDGSKELQHECGASANIISLYLATRGDHVLVGDLMRSVSLYLYKPQPEPQLELRAQDYATTWCTAVAMLDDDTYLAADNSHNLVVLRKVTDATTDEERGRLQLVGEYHLGEFVNRIRPGSLVLRLPDSELAQVPTWLFGTIDGTIGVLASLPPPLFEFLLRLQDAMRKVVKGVGGLSHVEFRLFQSERKTAQEVRGFVDGDLIELFLDLKLPEQQQVASLMGGNVEDIMLKVEELSRIH